MQIQKNIMIEYLVAFSFIALLAAYLVNQLLPEESSRGLWQNIKDFCVFVLGALAVLIYEAIAQAV